MIHSPPGRARFKTHQGVKQTVFPKRKRLKEEVKKGKLGGVRSWGDKWPALITIRGSFLSRPMSFHAPEEKRAPSQGSREGIGLGREITSFPSPAHNVGPSTGTRLAGDWRD